MTQKRRYEILLPAKYNDGRDVMQVCMSCFPQTLMKVSDQFGAFSYNPPFDPRRLDRKRAALQR